jgi:hypothetical protein
MSAGASASSIGDSGRNENNLVQTRGIAGGLIVRGAQKRRAPLQQSAIDAVGNGARAPFWG